MHAVANYTKKGKSPDKISLSHHPRDKEFARLWNPETKSPE